MDKCFFATCKQPVTHTVQRLWKPGGRELPMQHCCDQHIPGSHARAGIDPQPDTFYRVEKINHAA